MTTAKKATRATPIKRNVQSIQFPTLKKGERNVGLMTEKGEFTYWVILLPGKHQRRNFGDALTAAKKLGGDSPSRRELSLMRATAPEEFETDDYYWSNEQHSMDSGFAWVQDFDRGYQSYDGKSSSRRACAVRRVPI